MDSSSDSYLHKKFKKQQCSLADNKNVQSGKTSPNIQNKENQKNCVAENSQTQQQEQCIKIVNDVSSVNNSNSSVPTQSTNCLTNNSTSSSSLILSVQQSSSVSALSTTSPIVYSFVKSSISNVTSSAENHNRTSWNGDHKLDNVRSTGSQHFPAPNNSCISYVISNPGSRVDLTNFTSNREPANFDIKYNNVYDLTTTATSSILENSYPNQYHYVGGRDLVRIDDISIRGNQEDQLIQDQNQKIKRDENEIPEKLSEANIPDKVSGGKYVCNYCNLVCSKPSVLQKHIRAHTNERPFPCISCGFSFKTRSNLYKHCRSRTHANRVMGNKAQEITNEADVEKMDGNMQNSMSNENIREENRLNDAKNQDVKQKPYKPRFKGVFENSSSESTENKNVETSKSTNSDLLSLHIDELIHKNNSIVLLSSNDPYMFKKRNSDSTYMDSSNEYKYKETYSPNNMTIDHRNDDEPLNLTKSRKRSMSEVSEPIVQKSIIKELLLKNLYADSSKQCPYCKMIFQTVTELELHKLRSCKGYSKSGPKYNRSSSVNVASILTQNKNAFDTNPHIPNAIFPLQSPGPFLGKTRLVESDKSKSFSFDDSIQTTSFQSPFSNTHDLVKARYSLSPLTLQNDRLKKPPVKMFGGEVKITHSSGETKSFKIDGKEERYDRSYVDYGGNLSENRVVKSTLQSGGTVLHNKSSAYNKPDPKRSSPDVIRVYENTNISPGIDMIRAKFNFSRPDVIVDHNKSLSNETNSALESVPSSSYKYTNIMDYSQNAIKQFTPKLKQPNFSIPGIPVPPKIVVPQRTSLFTDNKNERPIDSWQKTDNLHISAMPAFPKDTDMDRRNSENIDFAQKQILLQQKMTSEPPKLQVPYNPMNVLVNGKIIRYVPGIPGPISADPPLDMAYSNNIAVVSPRSSSTNHLPKPNIRVTPIENKVMEIYSPKSFHDRSPLEINKSPKLQNTLTVKTEISTRTNEMRSPKTAEMKSPKTNELKSPKMNESKSPVIKSPSLTTPSVETPKKFARPNSLALKPIIPGSKQHHGLTPTIFNQILISPDTPRVAKKYNHQILHGNYFSYLGLKSSTKPTYCTLNKTQPFYVPHFKKLSMYSEWTQRDTKTDKLFLSAYDSRQKQQMYTTSGKATADLIIHSSYKFTVTEPSTTTEEPIKNILGGYESNDDYTYVRGRGRGRYVCDQCGIRCKKPSMLKKHIRTHSNDRPFTCSHCNFSFKTKGNLTKHMKSKAHTKNYAAYSSNSSNSSAQQSGTPTSESDTDDSGMDSSDESSTRHQEREAIFGLLSLSQKPAVSENRNSSPSNMSGNSTQSLNIDTLSSFMDTEQIAHVTKTNYAKNKILDQSINFNASKLSEISFNTNTDIQEKQKLSQYLGKANTNRPLTYPYTNALSHEVHTTNKEISDLKNGLENNRIVNEKIDLTKQVHITKKCGKYPNLFEKQTYKNTENTSLEDNQSVVSKQNYERNNLEEFDGRIRPTTTTITMQVLDTPQNFSSDLRKRKGSLDHDIAPKIQKNDSEVIDLSITSNVDRKTQTAENVPNGFAHGQEKDIANTNQSASDLKEAKEISNMMIQICGNDKLTNTDNTISVYNNDNEEIRYQKENMTTSYENEQNLSKPNETPMEVSESNHVNINYVMQDQPTTAVDQSKFKQAEYDNSAMETLADIATKQEKLEKNSIAKNVASEFLKLAIKNECQNSDGLRDTNFISSNKDVNELIGKPEENKSCTICSKSFCKPSQLKLHMNIHYLERPYRCDSCSVSFRTKGHLQKHERSASHHNKLSSSPNLSSSEPRPFKCSDCNIAFRIHGHLAKHLRAKMHIMKLECLNKIPFGLYAELERSNSLLTEINTTDGDQCLESLKMLAKKVFTNDPNKLNQLGPSSTESIDTDS